MIVVNKQAKGQEQSLPPSYPREDAAQQLREATAALRKLFPYMFLLAPRAKDASSG